MILVSSWVAAGAALACLLLAMHPFTTYPVTLAVLARWRPRPMRAPAAEQALPSVAVCICAFNEEGVIAERVANVLALRETVTRLDVLVYVDGSTDRTADILRSFGAAITTVISPHRLGKTHGMNTLVGMTRSDIVVFSDANVTFAPDALVRLSAPFADPAVGCVCGHLRYGAAAGETAATGSLYWRLEEWIKSLESATGSVMGADGSIFAIRRSLHEPPPPDLIDDMHVSLGILCRGSRIVRAADAWAFESSVSVPSEEFRRKARIACQAFNVHRALRPQLRRLGLLDRYKYVSHKLLRWLCIFSFGLSMMLAGAALCLAGQWAALLGATVVGGISLGVFLTVRGGPVGRIREVASALLATGLGVWKSTRGQRFQTWTPPASARTSAGLLGGEA